MAGLYRHNVNRDFKNICACTSINLNNPNESLCGFAIKLITLRRDTIFSGRVPKCSYVKPAGRK